MNETKQKIEQELQHRERLNNIRTVVKNRIGWCKKGPRWGGINEEWINQGEMKAYDDVLKIIDKEERLELPYANQEGMYVEIKLKEYRDSIMERIINLEQYRGGKEYDKMFRLARKVAEMVDEIAFSCFELGCAYGKGEDLYTPKIK